ncbi:hypothetical protein GCM10023157_10800 [Gluconacetobacter asukensis]
MTRAGLRIRQALDVYVRRVGQSVPETWELFWASRMMIAKGTWTLNPLEAGKIFNEAFEFTQPEVTTLAITGQLDRGGSPSSNWAWSAHRTFFADRLLNGDPALNEVTEYLKNQSFLFQSKVSQLLAGHSTAVLVDTGWVASSQRMLMKALPETEWWGLYFGLSGNQTHDRTHWPHAIPLVFQSDQVDLKNIKSCILAYRHLIESLFEPAAPSIEAYRQDDNGVISAVGEHKNICATDYYENDPLYKGVMDYLSTAPEDPAEITAAANAAWQTLCRFILLPTRSEALMFKNLTRSADLGRSFVVPVLLETDETSANDRIVRALWHAGQVALEFDENTAPEIQKKIIGLQNT